MAERKKKEAADLTRYEREIFPLTRLIAGVDEVGRGSLAGPVSVCAYIPDFEHLIEGVNDSKQLTERKREALFPLLTEHAKAYCVVHASVERIEEINILNAVKEGMKKAVAELDPKAEFVLTDALDLDYGVPAKGIVHGDALSYSIAAASVVAKVTRDRMMTEYAALYPEYGFERNKGYGTAQHIEAIRKYGPCPIHRLSFIKKFLD